MLRPPLFVLKVSVCSDLLVLPAIPGDNNNLKIPVGAQHGLTITSHIQIWNLQDLLYIDVEPLIKLGRE